MEFSSVNITPKKILVLTPRFPYPVIGGDRLRIYELCKEASKTHSLTLLSFCESEREMKYNLPDDGVFDSVHRVYLPRYVSFFNCVRALPTSVPLQVAYYKSQKFRDKVKELCRESDLVLSHLVRVAQYAKDLPIPKVLEMTDAISMNYDRVCKTENKVGIKGLIYRLERDRLNLYEKQIATYFDLNVLVSSFDRDYLFKDDVDTYKKTIVCSNGVDTTKYSYEFSPLGKELIFIGNMYSVQNMDAAVWFAENVLPVLRKLDSYKFKVIGRIKPSDFKMLNSIPGVTATGSVPDISLAARGAVAGICSVRLAAGVQNKILEYMALGIPTITSSIGLEGLEAKIGHEILVADSVVSYVEHITELDKNLCFAKLISENAYSYVKRSHSWSSKLGSFCHSINNLT